MLVFNTFETQAVILSNYRHVLKEEHNIKDENQGFPTMSQTPTEADFRRFYSTLDEP